MAVRITHSVVEGGTVDETAAVDGAAWDAEHVVTGLENVPNVDTTNASNITSGTLPVAQMPASAAPLDITAWHVLDDDAAVWNVARADGTSISTAGTVTHGIQEAIDAAYTGIGTSNSDLDIRGGNKSSGGALVANTGHTISFPPSQGKRTRIGAVNFNINSDIGATPGMTFDSSMMSHWRMEGGQTVYQGTGQPILFKPITGVPFDHLLNIVDSHYFFTTCAPVKIDLSTPGAGATNSTYDFGELNYQVSSNGAPSKAAFFVPSVLPSSNYCYNTFTSHHLHGVPADGTAWKIGDGTPANGQFFGRNFHFLQISGDSGYDGIDTWESDSFYLVTIDNCGTGTPIRFNTGSNNNFIIAPHYDDATTPISDSGSGNIVAGNGKIQLGSGASIRGGANTLVAAAALKAGEAGAVQGSVQIGNATAGTTTITNATNGGNPVLQTPNSPGTIAVSASAPLSLNSGTGDVTLLAFGGGDVSFAANGGAGTIATNAVTNTKAAQMATHTIKGNNTGSTANALDLTVPQVVAMFSAPQVSVFTTGAAATYTTPANAKYLVVELVGPGGGGGGSGTTPGNGAAGSAATTFGALSAGAGGGGTNATGGAAGAVSGGDINIACQSGGNPTGATSQSGGQGTPAAMYSVFAPLSGVGNVGVSGAGYGAGGSGAGDSATPNTGGGGAGGGYLKKLITSPSATYTYTVGAGGAGGTAGTSGFVGGAGTGGLIIVTAYFQ